MVIEVHSQGWRLNWAGLSQVVPMYEEKKNIIKSNIIVFCTFFIPVDTQNL